MSRFTARNAVVARMTKDDVFDQIDLGFVEAAHYDRQWSCEPKSHTQRDAVAAMQVEFVTPTSVPVLALPVLYCMGCGLDKPCTLVHKVDDSLGCCPTCEQIGIRSVESYDKAEMVTTTATPNAYGVLVRN